VTPATPAQAGWRAAQSVGALAEMTAALPLPVERARAMVRAAAEGVARVCALQDHCTSAVPTLIDDMRTRVANAQTTVFDEWARDAAEAFGDAAAARATHETLAAIIDGIRIIDDIQDAEEVCLATRVGTGPALNVAMAAFAHALERVAALPFDEEAWRAAVITAGRGIRETAIGQELETQATASAESYWNVVDRKTPPLVATALELGALAAGASPQHAAALTRLAIPLGRVLQIGDDCIDALEATATDWRAPHLNLLMLYSLSGPHAAECNRLLRDAGTSEGLRELQMFLLRDGALSYAMHARLALLDEIESIVASLALPHPAPFLRLVERQRTETNALRSLTSAAARSPHADALPARALPA
jgi:hypothetical protein